MDSLILEKDKSKNQTVQYPSHKETEVTIRKICPFVPFHFSLALVYWTRSHKENKERCLWLYTRHTLMLLSCPVLGVPLFPRGVLSASSFSSSSSSLSDDDSLSSEELSSKTTSETIYNYSCWLIFKLCYSNQNSRVLKEICHLIETKNKGLTDYCLVMTV